MFSSQKRLESQGNLRSRNRQLQYRRAQYQRELVQYQRELEDSIIQVLDSRINWSAKTFVLAILTGTLSVVLRRGALIVASIQNELELLGLYLERDTIQMLIELHQQERDPQVVIGKALSDREANEDLKQFYIGLQPTIKEAAASININISGPVQGLVVGSHNEIDEAFRALAEITWPLLQMQGTPERTLLVILLTWVSLVVFFNKLWLSPLHGSSARDMIGEPYGKLFNNWNWLSELIASDLVIAMQKLITQSPEEPV